MNFLSWASWQELIRGPPKGAKMDPGIVQHNRTAIALSGVQIMSFFAHAEQCRKALRNKANVHGTIIHPLSALSVLNSDFSQCFSGVIPSSEEWLGEKARSASPQDHIFLRGITMVFRYFREGSHKTWDRGSENSIFPQGLVVSSPGPSNQRRQGGICSNL